MILELLTQDGFSPIKKGALEYASPCPACGGDDRFIIWADSDRYWCRQCGSSGDAIDYLRQFHHMSFRDAAERVGKEELLSASRMPESKTNTASVVKKDQINTEQPTLWRQHMGQMIEGANQQLINSPSALDWLRSERGITLDKVKRFHLGWIDHNQYLKREEIGLDENGKKLFIPSGLLIPWQNIRVRVRRDNPSEFGRYYVVPGSKSDPFIIGNFHQNTAVILESELDAILLSQESSRPLFIVALGNAQKKPDHALLEMLNLCPVVLIALDNDKAGAKSARWWLGNLNNSFRTLSPKKIGKDLTDAYLSGLDLNEWLSVSIELVSERIFEIPR